MWKHKPRSCADPTATRPTASDSDVAWRSFQSSEAAGSEWRLCRSWLPRTQRTWFCGGWEAPKITEFNQQCTTILDYATHLECRKCIRCYVKRWHLNVLEKVEEFFGVQHDFCQSFIACALAQHCTAVESNLLMLVACHQRKENLRFCANIFDSWRSSADLSSKYIVEHLRHVLLALEVDPIKVLDEKKKQVAVIQFLC